MASDIQGYRKERFVTEVNRNFFCSICGNVLRDPVQCRNEHHFCHVCITRHLQGFHTCPLCLDELTLETLVQASRIVKSYLNELQIHCINVIRGCVAILQLQHLQQHEANCPFAPVVCRNQGCGAEVDRRDLEYHENEVCEFRELKCHSCKVAKMLEDMEKKIKRQNPRTPAEEWKLKREKDKLDCIKIRMKLKDEKAKLEFKVKEIKFKQEKAGLEREIEKISKMELIVLKVELQFQEDEVMLLELERAKEEIAVTNLLLLQLRQLEDGLKSVLNELDVNDPELFIANLELKLQAMVNDFKEINQELKSSTASKPEPEQRTALSGLIGSHHIIVLGGRGEDGQSLTSVEGFMFHEGRWIELPPMNISRFFMSSVIVDNEIIVSGGDTGDMLTDTIETLNLGETPLQWVISDATLPVPLSGHQTVVYQGKLITIGGHDGNEGRNSDQIYEVPLTPPYAPRVLALLPQPRAWHGAELVNDKIFIFGGGRNPSVPNDEVVVCDLLRNQCHVINQLPYRVQGMATVRFENKVYLLGGVDEREEELDKVITYDTESGETTPLPSMRQRRGGCCAVICPIVGSSGGCSSDTPTDSLVALGSLLQLNTVERFDFHSYAWSDMPSTTVARELSAVVVSHLDLNISES